jgi:hypothetical protein
LAAATLCLTFANAVVAAAGTAVAPSSPIPDNCVAVTLLNTSSTIPALFGIASAGAGTLTEGTNACRIPPGGSLTIPMGAITQRGPMDESQLAGSGLVYDGIGGAVTVDIIYQNAMGAIPF